MIHQSREAALSVFSQGNANIKFDGAGRADLVFEPGKQLIACEIANTTTPEHEVGNVRKCLKAGFPKVVVLAFNESRLQILRTAIEAELKKFELRKVSFYLPEQFERELKKWADRDPEGGEIERAKPRKQKLQFHAPTSPTPNAASAKRNSSPILLQQ